VHKQEMHLGFVIAAANQTKYVFGRPILL
jgi:hypothetical protein